MVENDSTEYKEKLTAGLEKEVVAFLNAHGGTIFIGVDRNGNAVGMEKCDAVQLEIKDRLITGIRPSIMGLFDIGCEDKDGKQIVRITVAAGKRTSLLHSRERHERTRLFYPHRQFRPPDDARSNRRAVLSANAHVFAQHSVAESALGLYAAAYLLRGQKAGAERLFRRQSATENGRWAV